jgi:molybdopterin converting factor small subunit
MQVTVQFYSYFRELAGCATTTADLPEGGTIDTLLDQLGARFPRLGALRKSTLVAVGVEYQHRDYVLKSEDEVSVFPPVQGG